MLPFLLAVVSNFSTSLPYMRKQLHHNSSAMFVHTFCPGCQESPVVRSAPSCPLSSLCSSCARRHLVGDQSVAGE